MQSLQKFFKIATRISQKRITKNIKNNNPQDDAVLWHTNAVQFILSRASLFSSFWTVFFVFEFPSSSAFAYNMNTTFPSTSFSHYRISRFHCTVPSLRSVPFYSCTPFQRKSLKIYASSSEVDTQPLEETKEEPEAEPRGGTKPSTSSVAAPLDKDLKKVGF